MNLHAWLAVGLFALPAAAEEPSAATPDAEFLEFLGETVIEDDGFVKFVESGRFERELQQAEEMPPAPKDDDDER